MILVIRISGMVNIPNKVSETLFRMRLRRKYAAVVLNDSVETQKLLKVVRNYTAYGTIPPPLLERLIIARGKSIDGKEIDAKKIVKSLGSKKPEDLGIKPFFRLHPPRKGIDSKKHFEVNKGVLGDNKNSISELLVRML